MLVCFLPCVVPFEMTYYKPNFDGRAQICVLEPCCPFYASLVVRQFARPFVLHQLKKLTSEHVLILTHYPNALLHQCKPKDFINFIMELYETFLLGSTQKKRHIKMSRVQEDGIPSPFHKQYCRSHVLTLTNEKFTLHQPNKSKMSTFFTYCFLLQLFYTCLGRPNHFL